MCADRTTVPNSGGTANDSRSGRAGTGSGDSFCASYQGRHQSPDLSDKSTQLDGGSSSVAAIEDASSEPYDDRQTAMNRKTAVKGKKQEELNGVFAVMVRGIGRELVTSD